MKTWLRKEEMREDLREDLVKKAECSGLVSKDIVPFPLSLSEAWNYFPLVSTERINRAAAKIYIYIYKLCPLSMSTGKPQWRGSPRVSNFWVAYSEPSAILQLQSMFYFSSSGFTEVMAQVFLFCQIVILRLLQFGVQGLVLWIHCLWI